MSLSTIDGGDGMPPEPDWVSRYNDVLDQAIAHEAWGEVVRNMQSAGTLGVENGPMIKRLVEFHVIYERAARHVAENGVIQLAKRTKVPQVNPYFGIMKQTSEAMRLIEVELGIPPIRRAKAGKVERKKTSIRAADAYLKPVKK
jgi:P27 family predicted phage terminase small subunit